ncbi:MAG: DUF2993 domain-containing protein [Actinobacteria bacterium]|nr:DUF2993 domain-containing protein [Actinomycetota bacterium]
MSRPLKVLIIILAVILVLYVASELLIPVGAAWYIKREIKKRYPEAADVSVSVRAFPAFKLFSRKYSRLTIEAGGIKLEGITFDSIKLSSSTYPSGTFDAVIGQGEISNFFSVAGSYLENPQVTIEDSQIKVTGQVDFGFGPVNVTSTGTLVPRNGQEVFIVSDKITVGGGRVPGEYEAAAKHYISENPIFTVRQDLPFTITAIKAGGGKLTITGDADIEEALKFK